MSVAVDKSLLVLGGSGAALAVAGVVGKNTTEQTWSQAFKRAAPLFSLLFAVGWVLVAVAISRGRSPTVQGAVWLAAACIVASVTAMKSRTQKREPACPLLPVVLSVAWLGLGWAATSQLAGASKAWGIFAVALVLGSMLWILPEQRRNCVVDGPGMPMFVSAWAILVVANAVRGQQAR